MGKDTSLKHKCVDTTLEGSNGGSGAQGVSPVYPGGSGANLVEQPLWDSIASEPARLSGTPIRFYSVRRAKNRHPLYSEPSRGGNEWEFHGPWEMMGAFAFDQGQDIDDEVSAEGIQKTANAVLHLARKELERIDAPDPKVGDVIHLWDQQPFGSEFQYWDVKKANPDGNIFTNESFVQFRIELSRRSRFEPGRKVLGKRI
jgi:hypothetical protein